MQRVYSYEVYTLGTGWFAINAENCSTSPKSVVDASRLGLGFGLGLKDVRGKGVSQSERQHRINKVTTVVFRFRLRGQLDHYR